MSAYKNSTQTEPTMNSEDVGYQENNPHRPPRQGGAGVFLLPKIDQTRKLITKILAELRKRKKPPPSLFVTRADDENRNTYNTEHTCDLLNQLKDVLVVCDLQGINFADKSLSSLESSRSRGDPYRKKRSGILENILAVLYDIVQNDCRYKVLNPRPLRPPYALHAIVIDVAHLLINQNPNSPAWLYELGMTMIQGFNCFGDSMRSRLLEFYGDFLIPQLMSFKNPGNLKGSRKTGAFRSDNSLQLMSDDRISLANKEKSPHINITIDDEEEEVTPPVAIEVHLSDSDGASLSDVDLTDDEQSISHRRKAARILSKKLSISYTGEFNIDAYYIDSMFTPLLFSMVQFVTIEDSSLETLYQMNKTLGLMILQKPDLYLDIIEIMAHGDPASRMLATCMLFSFWGSSIGLPSIGEDLLAMKYSEHLRAHENLQSGVEDYSPPKVHNHQLYSHIFSDHFLNKRQNNNDKYSSIIVNNKNAQLSSPADVSNSCFQCHKPVVGFGLRCNTCKLGLHFECYNSDDGGFLTEYSSESGVHKMSTPRYSNLMHGPREVTSINNQTADSHANIISAYICGHTFHLINLFTLTLCMICRLPLWGIMHQGYRCATCNRFIHSSCLKSKSLETDVPCHRSFLSESDALIDHESLRESFKSYYDPILISEERILTYNYEELSIMATIFQMQNNILNNGLLAGCLMIKPEFQNPLSSKSERFEKFELQEAIALYESYLENGKVFLTSRSNEYWEGVRRRCDLWIISSEDYLTHLASVIKFGIESELTDVHLSVNALVANLMPSADNNVVSPDGILNTKELIMWVRKQLGFHSDFSAKILLQQMANYGLLDRIDGYPILFDDANIEGINGHECLFPLPFANECSPTVETLVASISACLSDVNVTVNECGFLLMTRRCWPDPYLSKYVLERLIYSIIEWVCDEDERLVLIAKEYTSSHHKPPGVRLEVEEKRGDLGHSNQRMSSYVPNTSGGGVYLLSRQMLKENYVSKWMSTIRDMDGELFCDIVYEQVWRVYEDRRQREESDDDSVFVELKTLHKMFSTIKTSQRSASSSDQPVSSLDNVISDPLEMITQIFEGNDEYQLTRVLQWMDLIVRSGCPLDNIYNMGIVDLPPDRPSQQSIPKRISNIPDPTQGANITVESSLMQYLLEYARFEKLEVRRDVVKSSWQLFTTAGLIFNKNEFIINSVPKLLPSVWEELAPINDFSSSITMPLLIRMIWADSHFFLASISKVFEHQSWEFLLTKNFYYRFDGLDNLYSLFSKLDEKFEVQRAGVFAYLGPVFSYFVCCLWDREEYVRTKAITYIRAMRPQHLRLAFKCWEGYFMVANNREKTLLCRFMIKLNAKFPKWKVIEWDILLDALNQESDESETVSETEILESYVRPDSILVVGLKNFQEEAAYSTPGQRAAEEQNLKVVMLTLALQMLANGIDITLEQITKLKYLIVKSLGFADCKLELINEVYNLSYGELKYNPEDFTQDMIMMSCLGNLKRMLDTPIYPQYTGETSEETVSPVDKEDELLGGFFVDVVFALFNSSVDMSKLSHLMLKHKIEDRYNKELEEAVISVMRKISDLLQKDITEENKQLSIELATALLKRSPMLTVNILGKQIIVLGKLLTKLQNDTNNPLVISATTFLRTAFLKFARNGLFVLIFKNQLVADENHTELDMYQVLRNVIQDQQIPTENESSEPFYLRDEPIRDVFNQLFKFTNRKIVSTILFNLSKYVELELNPFIHVNHSHHSELGQFITKLAKHTSEWKGVDWDVNPVLNMFSVIMKNNSASAKQILVQPMRGFLKQVINKCPLTMESLVKLLSAYDAINETTNVCEIIIEEMKATFRVRLLNRILLGTLIVDSSASPITTVFDFQDNIADLLLLALKNPLSEVAGEMNYLYTPSGELAYQSFVLIKIWTTLCSLISKKQVKAPFQLPLERDQQDKDKGKVVGAPRVHQKLSAALSIVERKFWNSIWPSIKKTLVGTIIEKELQPSGVAYWEMFVDLVTFLYFCGSDIVMLYSQEWFALVDTISKDEFAMYMSPEISQKIKQAHSMFNNPPLMMQEDMLITRLYLEMREAMRLYFEVNGSGVGKLFGAYI
ncbi:6847_t:CDS:10 [Acaulospora colombiana]|uniref:6847_t:CDS:1 n=1 Tax=Acaulospora colombiana TaxID=27376 RepID=A0ACA9KEW0_9GLOM|nr:6847_t:CDS:10 [Acaulospora colombiana]